MRLYQQQVRRENIRGDSSFGINHIWSLGSLIGILVAYMVYLLSYGFRWADA